MGIARVLSQIANVLGFDSSGPSFVYFSSDVRPSVNGTYNLGGASNRWSTVYTSDLSMSNGIGDYTMVEGHDDLFLYNNKTGKVFKFALIEVDPKDAPPKKEL